MIDQTISHYCIVDKLGGGMGVVDEAEDLNLADSWRSSFLPDDPP